jgi:integrase/recombinase XerD
LKFFFDVTLDRAELMAKMKPVFVPRTLPVVLSREEVTSLIAAAKNLKHQTALSVAYGAGLRANEVATLKVGDVDSTRMTLRIQQGKGGKDRYAMLSPVMLDRLRTCTAGRSFARGVLPRRVYLARALKRHCLHQQGDYLRFAI